MEMHCCCYYDMMMIIVAVVTVTVTVVVILLLLLLLLWWLWLYFYLLYDVGYTLFYRKQITIIKLYWYFNLAPEDKVNMTKLLQFMNIDPKMVRYNPEDESFY